MPMARWLGQKTQLWEGFAQQLGFAAFKSRPRNVITHNPSDLGLSPNRGIFQTCVPARPFKPKSLQTPPPLLFPNKAISNLTSPREGPVGGAGVFQRRPRGGPVLKHRAGGNVDQLQPQRAPDLQSIGLWVKIPQPPVNIPIPSEIDQNGW